MEGVESLLQTQNQDKLDFLTICTDQRWNNMIEGVNSQILEVVIQGDFYLFGLMQKGEIQIQEAEYWEFLFL